MLMRHSTFYINQLKNKFLLVGFLLFTCGLTAQVQSTFTPRFSDAVNGDFTIIANNVLSEHVTNDYNGEANNNSIFTVFVDIDSDATTFNSSSAQLVNPSPSSFNLSRLEEGIFKSRI